MASSQSKKKNLSKGEINKQKRLELFKELLPIIKSFGLWIVLVIIVAVDYTGKRWFSMAFVDYTTWLSYGISKILFIPARIIGDGASMVTTLQVNYKTIIISNYPLVIELECSAYHAYLAMLSLVVFAHWTKKQKLLIGTIIFAILSVVNSMRIVALGVIGHKFPQVFNVMHDYIWNILLVIIIWGLWELANQWLRKHSK